MEASKILAFLIFSALAIAGIRADEESTAVHVDLSKPEGLDSPLKLEIELLKSKISSLESTISDKVKLLKNKDEMIAQLAREVQEKEASVVSLRSEMELLQKRGAVDIEALVGKAHARANELEKQASKLKNEVEMLTRTRDTLESRAREAETKAEELSSKLESLNKINDEQKRKIQKAERALQVSEEELIRSRMEAISNSKELTKVHGAWLPPWLANQFIRCQDVAAAKWNEHGKPALNVLMQKASEKSGQAQKWVEPHIETAKSKWVIFTANAQPHIKMVTSKTAEISVVCRRTVAAHIMKLKDFANPYAQEARKFMKPYIEQVAIVTKPHVEKVQAALKPYTTRVIYGYGKFLESARTYHHQIQETFHETLKKHEWSKPLATKEFIWFMASASLALPIYLVYRILSVIFCKTTKKPARNARSTNSHRRHKRRLPDH
ncbi:hypothetical protein AXF42_Ash001888 [Apostasia shenzhenica]|uniref:Uncharacterized protein n=1 Tax=Apostasia shenzhenica TaxID=1088818 RepID=A0A2I0ABH9_9ASPA|nr:hypothetical protein AXF42_Ash001888 [Apostasia shenzhenica]